MDDAHVVPTEGVSMRLCFLLVSWALLPIDLASAGFRWLARKYYEHRRPPWMDLGHCTPLTEVAGEHCISFVSRHDIAECGLKCRKCREVAAGRGDYRGVRRTNLGEAVKCHGCGETLIASPDTEHGDDLLPYDKTRFHRFVRVSELQALREQYGDDMTGNLDRFSATPKRFKMREEVSLDPEQAALAAGIPWSDIEPPKE